MLYKKSRKMAGGYNSDTVASIAAIVAFVGIIAALIYLFAHPNP